MPPKSESATKTVSLFKARVIPLAECIFRIANLQPEGVNKRDECQINCCVPDWMSQYPTEPCSSPTSAKYRIWWECGQLEDTVDWLDVPRQSWQHGRW
jgi:hypothetical protein